MKEYGEVCTDNRFEVIKKYKERLIEATNIETSKDEMAVIDNILFRFWQMGWLDKLEADVVPRSEVEKAKQDVLREVFEKLGVYISQEVTIDLKEEAENYRQVIKEFAEIEINRAKQDVAREIFEEIEKTIMNTNWTSQNYKEWYFGELKKKYIGEGNERSKG